ncbi:hypothetical protein SK128_025734 [Halocaridina rubra]|uniref:Uncharacterized protein n=1 Tax=Halocaridina rubra TaxID=373956 RepID=A0AAN8X378_HALRR
MEAYIHEKISVETVILKLFEDILDPEELVRYDIARPSLALRHAQLVLYDIGRPSLALRHMANGIMKFDGRRQITPDLFESSVDVERKLLYRWRACCHLPP